MSDILFCMEYFFDHLRGLVVSVPGYRSRGSGSIPCATTFFWEVVGLERGPLSLVSTTEELIGRKSSCSRLESWEYGWREPLRWPRGTFYPQKLALTSLTIAHSVLFASELMPRIFFYGIFLLLLRQSCRLTAHDVALRIANCSWLWSGVEGGNIYIPLSWMLNGITHNRKFRNYVFVYFRIMCFSHIKLFIYILNAKIIDQ
jgi:hypothetical protein